MPNKLQTNFAVATDLWHLASATHASPSGNCPKSCGTDRTFSPRAYHYRMLCFSRVLLVCLMAILLPLRGWTGDVMAVDMVAGTIAKQATSSGVRTAVVAAPRQAAMPADCMMFASASPDAATHCSNCDTCELCLAVIDPTITTWSASQSLRHSSPLATSASFTSANSASNLKPPIF